MNRKINSSNISMKSYCWLFLLPPMSSFLIFDGNNSSKIDLDRSWELVEFVNSSREFLSIFEYEVHTLRFEESETDFNGEAACNYYGANYHAGKSGHLTVKNLAATEALCRQPSLGEEFVDALSKAKKFTRTEGQLVLFFAEDGKLTFSERLE